MSPTQKESYKIGRQNAWLGISSNILLFIVKFAAGVFGRSQAMLADAFHTGSDLLTSVGVLIGFKIAEKPADPHHPFGHGRAESIVAKVIAVILIMVGLEIAYKSAGMLIHGDFTRPGAVALAAAVISIVVKEWTYRKVILASGVINSTSLKADAYHHRSDAISSIAALIGIAGAMMGYGYMDPLAGVIVAGFIIKMGADVFHVAYDELMDAAPPEEFRRDIERIVLGVEGVDEVKRVMVRKTGIEFFIEVIIGVDGQKTVEQGHIVTIKIKRALKNELSSMKDVIVHVEPRSGAN